jgi:hypothetical protein
VHKPERAQVTIKRLQPHDREPEFRSDPLWQLHELSNAEEHRMPTPPPLITPRTPTVFVPGGRGAEEVLILFAFLTAARQSPGIPPSTEPARK